MTLIPQDLALHFFSHKNTVRPDDAERLEVVQRLSKDSYLIQVLVQSVYPALNTPLRQLLNLWIDFFSDHFHICRGVYGKLLSALYQKALSDPHFRSQSWHQMTLSQDFLKILFKQDKIYILNHTEEASYLLSLSLCVGKYPGMLRGGIRQSLQKLEGDLNRENLERVFLELFGRYEIPRGIAAQPSPSGK